jgi:lysophospholipid acyltransferase (LPLAT)-like uncharacterized protein
MAELAKQQTYSNRIWDRIALPAPGTELKVNLNQPTAICQETERKETVITKIFVVISSYKHTSQSSLELWKSRRMYTRHQIGKCWFSVLILRVGFGGGANCSDQILDKN